MTRQAGYYLCRQILKTRKIFQDVICPFSPRCSPHGSSLWNFCTKIKPILDHNSLRNDPWHFPLTGFSMLEPSILCMALSHCLHHTSCSMHGCDILRGQWSEWHYWGHQYLAPGSHLLTLSQVSRVTPSWHVMKLVTCYRYTASRPGRCLWNLERALEEENPCRQTPSSGHWTARTKLSWLDNKYCDVLSR